MNIVDRSSSTPQILAALIRTQINRGRWRDGAALRQEDLAAEYKVSRIPIREALAQLHAEGLIDLEPNRGARVSRLSQNDITEIFDLRVLLESEALTAAVPNHTNRTLRDLLRWQDALDEEIEPAAWIATDRAFHESLYAPAGRPRLLAMISQLRMPIERYGLRALSPESRDDWSDEHHALLKAVAEGDINDAINHLQFHLRATRDAILAAMGSQS